MKLRFRPFKSRETLKIHVPDSCTLPQLRQILSYNLPASPSPASIRLSLNREDDLQSDGPETLQSLGIAAGDLIYFSVGEATTSSDSRITPVQVTVGAPTPRYKDPQNSFPEGENSDSLMLDSQKRKTLDMSSPVEAETVCNMEVDDEGNEDNRVTDELLGAVDKSFFTVPGFLRKVFAADLGDDDGRRHKLIVIAIHAVMLESGFVGVDEETKAVVNGFQLRNKWPSGLFRMSLFYTLRESARDTSGEALKTIVLKFQSMGTYLNVYGELGKRGMHRVQLNEGALVPFLNVVWAVCGVMENVSGQDGGTSPEKEVFKFWRNVKDNLALPLLIDFCEEVGLELPPCFMRLPTELKLKILESLPGVDLAKVSCVSSELRYLASSDDLWKMKFEEEFSRESKEGHASWKKAFSMARSRGNGRMLASRARASPYWPVLPYWPEPRRRRYPNPLIFQRDPPILRDEPPPYGADDDRMRNELPLAYNLQATFEENDSTVHPMRNGLLHADDSEATIPNLVIHPVRFLPKCNLGSRW